MSPEAQLVNQVSSACVTIARFKARLVPLLQRDLFVTDALRFFFSFLSVGLSFLKPMDGESLGARYEALEVKRLQA